jgi:uncharacterized protein
LGWATAIGLENLMKIKLSLLETPLAVCQLSPAAQLPAWVFGLPFFSITRTSSELSIVAPEGSIPPDWKAERGWKGLKVEGQLDFNLTGILASLAVPLAEAGISIFAISTFDTDILLVKAYQMEKAVLTLKSAGFSVI